MEARECPRSQSLLYHVGPGIEFRSSGLVENAFNYCGGPTLKPVCPTNCLTEGLGPGDS